MFHEAGWLPNDLVCSPTTLDFSMIDRTNIVYFESYPMCGLGLPPSKFLVAILGYLVCKLIIYTYIRMTHYKLFSVILLTCKVSTSSTNYQLPHHAPIDKSPLHHAT
jgi:hypothetical protein